MESLFDEIFGVGGVHGLFLLSKDGGVVFEKFVQPFDSINKKKLDEFVGKSIDINYLTELFDKSNESLLIFGQKRIYIKKAGDKYLFIMMDKFAPVAMVRLNCQLIIPEIEKMKSSKGIGRFFRK